MDVDSDINSEMDSDIDSDIDLDAKSDLPPVQGPVAETPPSHVSESHTKVTYPSRIQKSRIRVAYKSQVSELHTKPLIRVAPAGRVLDTPALRHAGVTHPVIRVKIRATIRVMIQFKIRVMMRVTIRVTNRAVNGLKIRADKVRPSHRGEEPNPRASESEYPSP